MHFGGLLRALRTEAGLTQEQVAEGSGLSARAIGDLERSVVRRPRRTTVELLAAALGLGEKDARSLAEAARRPPGPRGETSGPEGVASGDPSPSVPRQLPRSVHRFTGREEQLGTLRRWSEAAARDGGSARVLTIGGMAGVGKTALAVEFGHSLVDQYPDGQLFLDLHGHTPGRTAVSPRAALARMLRAVGVGESRLGDDADELAELWRSLASDRRLLIVLDNAADAEQIRLLIPGRGGSLVLVTSRRRLPELDSAADLSLEVLAPNEAYALFVQVATPQRVVAQDADVREAVGRCGRLPLAVRIAAARLRHHPSWRVGDLLERLQDSGGDGEGRVAAAFEMSYARLDPEQQRVFRMLGLHPGADIDVYASAAMADLSWRRAQRLLEDLHEQHLVEEFTPGRYAFHDLMRQYARNKSAEIDGAEGEDSALLRLLDQSLYTASVAMNVIQPTMPHSRPTVAAPRTDTPRIGDAASARDWLQAEFANLMTYAALAADRGWPLYVTRLSHTLWRRLQDDGRYLEANELHGLAVAAARAAGDHGSLVKALRFRAIACMRLGRFEESIAALEEARESCEDAEDLAAVAESLGNVNMVMGRLAVAEAEFDSAGAVWRSLGRVDGAGNCLAAVGIICFRLGRYETARDNLLQSLALRGEQASPAQLASTVAWLGTVAERTGDYAQACEYADRALGIARSEGRSGSVAIALSVRGRARQRLGLLDESLADLEQSLAIRRRGLELPDLCISLLSLGTHHHLRGDPRRAADHFREALALTRNLDVPASRLTALIGLGESRTALGDPLSALTHHRRALELARRLSDPYLLARAQEGLGYTLRALSEADDPAAADVADEGGDLAQRAAMHLSEAYEAYRRLGVPDAGRIALRSGSLIPRSRSGTDQGAVGLAPARG
jgi:tetratricopeptide (TPR) repeat protein/transcriptional regulator with XRE-family HTH domain